MDSGQFHGGTPAPYGRACINCSRAKSKCILLAAGMSCERCQRLKKDCRPSPTVRKRNGRSSASKAAQLEAKLDSIVSLLQTGGGPSSLPTDWESTVSQAKYDAIEKPRQPVPGLPFSYASAAIPSPMSSASATSSYESNPIQETCDTLAIPPDTAEKTLSQFRTQNLRFLPFAHIPPHMTSQQLRQEKPFFWLCIMAVLSPGNPAREALFNKISDIIHREVLVAISPSLDILLGVMTFMSWTTYSKRPFLNFYAHVIMGIVCDLGINQAIPTQHTTLHIFKCAVGWRQPAATTRTLEERRAVLGCFLITSCIALSMFRIDALRWNPYMEESLTVLTDANECPEDELLVSLVKIQLVVDKVYQSRRDGDINQSPSPIYTKSFQSQLESVKGQIPQYLQQDHAIQMHLASAELTIHEIALRPPSLPHSPDIHRLESLCISLQASKSWLEHWISISPERYMGVSFTMFFQFARALVNLFKLSTLDDPAWDRSMVRNTANIIEYLDRMSYNLKRCAEELPVADDPEWNIFEKGTKMVQCLKAGWEPRLMEIWFPNLPSNGIDGQFPPSNPPISDVLPATEFDDAWMMEIFGAM
ncbi:uncharacterized protein N7459_002735 [Penicillium hispanicum]|uniref:uncharacterized protein n=1 Tax=Penicillium hispanicum TaxID=1080232 RepID=UPI00253FEE16|nr:uncharacterized protein N7459_002735 [Penicillium hispanicum]KAJ5586970.1 hypothetical protein N7459_002735 [Penicillium hispanicum]